MNQEVRLLIVEAASQRELEESIADMEAHGWRSVDGRTIAAPTRDAPFWVQILYWSPRPLPVR
jgi:hypothetical protein